MQGLHWLHVDVQSDGGANVTKQRSWVLAFSMEGSKSDSTVRNVTSALVIGISAHVLARIAAGYVKQAAEEDFFTGLCS